MAANKLTKVFSQWENPWKKMMYLLWKTPGEQTRNFKETLLNDISTQLFSAGARSLRFSIVDDDVEAARALHLVNTLKPIDAIVSIWIDSAVFRQPIEQRLADVTESFHGYLVTESEPIVNTTQSPNEYNRTPGMSQLAFLRKPVRLDYSEWIDIWQNSHTRVAIDTQSTFGYRQNAITRPLTVDAPAIDAIVEENFPAAAMTDQHVFFNTEGNEEKLQSHRNAMAESCKRFIDFDQIDVTASSEYTMTQ
ncbi:MAG: EthD domain-containing protein [Pseudomonadales bacterium]